MVLAPKFMVNIMDHGLWKRFMVYLALVLLISTFCHLFALRHLHTLA